MRRLTTAVLLTLTMSGCNSCNSQQPVTDDVPEKRGKRRKGRKAKAKAKAQPTYPPKDTVTTVIYKANDTTMVWLETRSGTFSGNPDRSYWLKDGIALPEFAGYRYFSADGSDYLSTTAPSGEGVQTFTALMATETSPPPGYSWEVDPAPNGFHRTFVKPASGRMQRLGMYKQPPSKPVWMEATRPEKRGEASPPLTRNSGWKARGDLAEGYQNALPEGAKPLEAKDLDAQAVTKLKAELKALRDSAITVHLAKTVNLDADESLETFACITGGMGAPCVIIDQVGEERRVYSANMAYPGKDADAAAEAPLFFSTETGHYAMFSPKGSVNEKGQGVITVVRFNGNAFVTDAVY
ncbi:MAG: hypothetical protein AAFV53_11885 [Myxococcota bacterium]